MIQTFDHIPNMVSFDPKTDMQTIKVVLPFTFEFVQRDNSHRSRIISHLRDNCKGKWGKQYGTIPEGLYDNLPITIYFELLEDALRTKLVLR